MCILFEVCLVCQTSLERKVQWPKHVTRLQMHGGLAVKVENPDISQFTRSKAHVNRLQITDELQVI